LAADGEVLEIMGIDLLQDWQFPSSPDTSARSSDFLSLLTEPDACIVADTFASRHGLKTGGMLPVIVNGQTHHLRVRAIIHPTQRYDDSLIVMDVAATQELFDRIGYLDRVDILLNPGASRSEFEMRARASLPASAVLEPPGAAQEQAQKMTEAFQLNLTALSMVALMVGMFLIYNTVAVSVVRRRPEIGIMRALGASQGQIFTLFLLEGGVLGGLGCLLGLGFGVLLSRGAVEAVTRTVNSLYVPTRAGTPELEPGTAFVCLLVGFVMSLLSSWLPAREAARVPPAEAMGRGAQNLLHRPRLWRLVLLAGALLAATALLAKLPPVQGIPVAGYLACLCVLLASAALAGPTVWVLTLAGQRLLVRLFGAPAMAATTHLIGAIKRIAVAVGALTVGMAMVSSVGIMVNSFRETVISWVDTSMRADLFITAEENRSTVAEGRIPGPALQIVRSTPGVDAVDAFYGTMITYQGEPAFLGEGDLDVLGRRGHLMFRRGESRGILLGCVNADHAIVSETFASRHDVREGDVLHLDTPRGPLELTITGVYYDYSQDAGWIVMDRSTWVKSWGTPPVTNISLYLAPGRDADAVRRTLRERLNGSYALNITTNRTLRQNVLRVFNQTFAVTHSIELIAVVVAVLGVATTLIALVIERRREISVLRCLGAVREQIVTMVLLEAAAIGISGVLLGLAAGDVLSLLLIHVINKQCFGWTLFFHFPFAFIAQVLALILCATLASAVHPAMMAARVDPATNLRNE
ncbi:MAG: ABC transporter permease, partial [Candidatus Xenobia bacterium]